MFQSSCNDFEFIKRLGDGCSSNVYLVRKKNSSIIINNTNINHCEGQELYALKCIDKKVACARRLFANEVKIYQRFSDISEKYFPKLYNHFEDANYYYLLLEYFPGGDLHTRVFNSTEELSMDDKRLIIAQMVLILQRMRQLQIVFRDLKLENLMVDVDGYIRLVDFGYARVATARDRLSSSVGTYVYMAPEMIGENKTTYDFSVDLYSMGILVYEILSFDSGVEPTTSRYNVELDALDPAAKSLIEGLMAIEPKQRLGFFRIDDIISHPFFKDTNWTKIVQREYVSGLKPKLARQDDTTYYNDISGLYRCFYFFIYIHIIIIYIYF